MINNDILEYIKAQRAAGTADEMIRANLHTGGWEDADVDEAFKAVAGQQPAAPAVASTPVEVAQPQPEVQSAPTTAPQESQIPVDAPFQPLQPSVEPIATPIEPPVAAPADPAGLQTPQTLQTPVESPLQATPATAPVQPAAPVNQFEPAAPQQPLAQAQPQAQPEPSLHQFDPQPAPPSEPAAPAGMGFVPAGLVSNAAATSIEQAPEEATGGSTAGKIILGIAILILLAAGGAAAYALMGGFSDDATIPAEATTSSAFPLDDTSATGAVNPPADMPSDVNDITPDPASASSSEVVFPDTSTTTAQTPSSF